MERNPETHHTATDIVEAVERKTFKLLAGHKLIVMVSLSILIAIIMVGVAMSLYNSSGTALLDLSSPQLQEARKQIVKSDENKQFSSTGQITSATLDEFRKLYDKQVKNITAVDAYSVDPVTDKALGLDDPAGLPPDSH